MNDAIAMMFSILIVMFGYLVFKIRTDKDLRYEDFVESSWKEIEK